MGLGAALRRAWLGYQLRLDRAMAEAGFGERRFPDGRVLRVCSTGAGSTISDIGRELGITRQGAGKVVAHLRDRGYVAVADSTTSKREKSVVLTPLGVDYLANQNAAARAIEDELRTEFGTRPSLRWERCSARWTPGTTCAYGRTFVTRPACSSRPKPVTPPSPRRARRLRCRQRLSGQRLLARPHAEYTWQGYVAWTDTDRTSPRAATTRLCTSRFRPDDREVAVPGEMVPACRTREVSGVEVDGAHLGSPMVGRRSAGACGRGSDPAGRRLS